MNHNYLVEEQNTSKTGYNPNIQVTTGTYCVTKLCSQSSGGAYIDATLSIIKRSL